MPTYISLINFTQKGAEAIKDGPKRLEAAKQRFRDAGAELKAFYTLSRASTMPCPLLKLRTTKWSQSSPLGPRRSDLYGRRLVGRSQRATIRR
jgi:hypothetical protein